jgi:hypothetical protein
MKDFESYTVEQLAAALTFLRRVALDGRLSDREHREVALICLDEGLMQEEEDSLGEVNVYNIDDSETIH